MANEHISPQGLKAEYSTDGVTYVEITDLKSVTPPGLEWEKSDDTCLKSPSATKESTAGWAEGSELAYDAFLMKAQESALLAQAQSRKTLFWRLTYAPLSSEPTQGTEITFSAWIKSWKPQETSTGSSDKIHCQWTVQTTGVVAVVQGK